MKFSQIYFIKRIVSHTRTPNITLQNWARPSMRIFGPPTHLINFVMNTNFQQNYYYLFLLFQG